MVGMMCLGIDLVKREWFDLRVLASPNCFPQVQCWTTLKPKLCTSLPKDCCGGLGSGGRPDRSRSTWQGRCLAWDLQKKFYDALAVISDLD